MGCRAPEILLENLGSVSYRSVRTIQPSGHGAEAVDHTVVALYKNRNTCLAEPAPIVLAFIAEDIVLGGLDQGWRQAVECLRKNRSRVMIARLRLGPEVLTPIPLHLRHGKKWIVSEEL